MKLLRIDNNLDSDFCEEQYINLDKVAAITVDKRKGDFVCQFKLTGGLVISVNVTNLKLKETIEELLNPN